MIEQRVRDLLEEEVAKMGIVIDRDKIIDIETCVEVTKVINPLFDEANIIEDAYILDISSKEKGEL